MTELLINGYQVVLPKDFACTVKTENPILTKNGEYTYDITLSLGNDANKRVFGHLDRVNNSSVKTEWPAVMIVNNQVLLNGRAILVSNTDREVSIQLVSGNSEFNFLIGSDKLISSLDLGNVNNLSQAVANQSLNGHWPEWNYVITPIYAGRVFNEYTISLMSSEWAVSDMIIQPYLIYYTDAIPAALGYKVTENVLHKSVMMSMLYVLNLSSSTQYKDFLPGWTVSDFISEVEKFCNVVFVIDKDKKSVRILDCRDIVSAFPIKTILKSIDNYSVENTEEVNDEIAINYNSIGYDLPDSEYFKFMSIDKAVTGSLTSISMPTFKDLYELYKSDFGTYYNKSIIYRAVSSDTYYVIDKNTDGNYYFRRVNLFEPVGVKSDDEEPTQLFRIIPAEIKVRGYSYPAVTTGTSYDLFGYTQMPVSSIEKNDTSSSEAGLINKIKSGISKEKKSDKIEVALYFGKSRLVTKNNDFVLTTPVYPLSITDYIVEYVESKEGLIGDGWIDSFNLNADYTLRLSTRWGRWESLYSKNSAIEATRKFEITFPVENVLDPRSIFIIKNKSFLCKEIEYKVTPNGFGALAKGVFYPYKLSKQTREWILKDYAWDDAGKWDDNQPWQDINPDLDWTLTEGYWNDISLFTEDGEWNDNAQTT